MRYRTLGASGCSVSTLSLGTMTFGSEADETNSHAQLDRFFEAGGNLVDTADVYSGTKSESIIGRWLAKQSPEIQERLVIATKGRFPTGDGPNDVGLSRQAFEPRHRRVATPARHRLHRPVPGPRL